MTLFRHKPRTTIRNRTCLSTLALESREVPAGFSDNFEGATLNSFWSTEQTSGTVVFPATVQHHSGLQSVGLTSVQTRQNKWIAIKHAFPQPVYGHFSVWVYDTGANVASSNYFALRLSNGTQYTLIQGRDYNHPTYDYQFMNNNFSSGVPRSQAWHKLELTTSPTATTFSIDGGAIATQPPIATDEVRLLMYGPPWRPAWASYFDDFAFMPADSLPPQVQSLAVGDGSAQRSRVLSLTATIDSPVTLPANPATAFQLSHTGPSGTGNVPLTVDTSLSTPTQTIVRLTFPSSSWTDSGSLADGNYQLTVLGNQITDLAGQPLDGDANGTSGGDYTFNFHRLFGDTDGDRDIDAADFGPFRQGFGTPSAAFTFDFDGDGDVDAADFGQFRQRFGTSV